jgi:hypothetical protein
LTPANYMQIAFIAGALSLSLLSVLGCGDPVHDDDVNSLGPEGPGGTGALHRAGQPCDTCHGGRGPAKATFSVAGTIFKALEDEVGLNGAVVTLTDSNNKTHTETTNAVGNFYVHADDFTPAYPMHVEIDYGGVKQKMGSHVGRDGSCAGCHHDPQGTSSPGHIFLSLTEADVPAGP